MVNQKTPVPNLRELENVGMQEEEEEEEEDNNTSVDVSDTSSNEILVREDDENNFYVSGERDNRNFVSTIESEPDLELETNNEQVHQRAPIVKQTGKPDTSTPESRIAYLTDGAFVEEDIKMYKEKIIQTLVKKDPTLVTLLNYLHSELSCNQLKPYCQLQKVLYLLLKNINNC